MKAKTASASMVCTMGGIAWAALALAWSVPANAQEPATNPPEGMLPETMTLSQLLALAKARSPKLAAERSRIGVAEALRVGAEIYPNPSFSYSGAALVSGDNYGSQHTVSLEQPILLGGKRDARRSLADARVNAARAEVQISEAGLSSTVRHLFVSLLVRQRQVELMDMALHDLEALRDVVSARAQAGFKSRYDVLRFEGEVDSFRAQLREAQTSALQVSGELGKTLGLPGWHPNAVGDTVPMNASLSPGNLWVEAQVHHPALVSARAEETAAAAGIDVAQAERWPDLSIGAGASITTGGTSVTPFASLSIPLPFFDRNQGAIATALAESQAAALQRQAAIAEVKSAIAAATAMLDVHRRQLADYERDVLAHLPEIHQMAEAAYRNGQSALLDLLDSLRSESDRRMTHLNLLEEVLHAEIDALAASGKADWIPEPKQ